MTYRTLIEEASRQLSDKNINPHNAIFLMMELANKESYDLYLHYDDEVEQALQSTFLMKLKRLLQYEPLQHILGYEYFYGYKFIVNQDVLIPRDETQELVSNVLVDIDEFFKNPTLLDVGCGSGIIGITLKKEEPSIRVFASDISENALKVAKQNATALEADVKFLMGDMLEPFIENNIKADILVSNPPYIKTTELLEKSVIDYEPNVALFGGEDGLYFYRKIFEKARMVLNQRFMMAFEMGFDQKDDLVALAKHYFPDAKIEVLKDLNQKDRMLFIYEI